jgi:hypothetical protein
MLKINKVLKTKIISFIVAIVFILNNTVYGIDISNLRVPIGDFKRLNAALTTKPIGQFVSEGDDAKLEVKLIGDGHYAKIDKRKETWDRLHDEMVKYAKTELENRIIAFLDMLTERCVEYHSKDPRVPEDLYHTSFMERYMSGYVGISCFPSQTYTNWAFYYQRAELDIQYELVSITISHNGQMTVDAISGAQGLLNYLGIQTGLTHYGSFELDSSQLRENI